MEIDTQQSTEVQLSEIDVREVDQIEQREVEKFLKKGVAVLCLVVSLAIQPSQESTSALFVTSVLHLIAIIAITSFLVMLWPQ